MLHQQTVGKLHTMKLFGMVEALEEQRRQSRAGELGFEDRLALLVERQWLWREDRALRTRLQHARLRQSACVEEIDYRHHRGLQRSVLEHLATSEWVRQRQHCVITGPTGVGKTYIACALAHKACREGYRALYIRCPRLFQQLALARADGSYGKLLARIAKVHVLLIDDLGLAPMSDSDRRDLLEIIEDRHGCASTIVTSQLPLELWHDNVGDPTLADAILDRLVHNAHRIELKGASMRKTKQA